ncbi:MAG: hypothetical protein IPG79_20080 [Saprospiraceae bacterium]|nr:hypothetical protein [Saprospiraceae bacterium]
MTKLLCIIGLFLLPFDGFGQLPVFSEDTPDFYVKILPNLQLSVFLKKEKGGIIKTIDIKDFHEIMLSDSNQGFEDKKNYRLISAD